MYLLDVSESTDPTVREAGKAFSAADLPLRTKQAKAVEEGIPTAHVVSLPGADHYVYLSNEPDVLREVNSFLSPFSSNRHDLHEFALVYGIVGTSQACDSRAAGSSKIIQRRGKGKPEVAIVPNPARRRQGRKFLGLSFTELSSNSPSTSTLICSGCTSKRGAGLYMPTSNWPTAPLLCVPLCVQSRATDNGSGKLWSIE